MTVDTLVAVFKADIKDFVAGAAKVDRSFRGMSRVSVWAMARVGSAVADAGRKMLGFAKDTIKTGMEFEQAMANVRAVLPITDQLGENFEALSEKIKALGRDTLFSATEAAEGAEFLAKAGFDAREIIASLPAVLQLATAGELELAKAGDIATNVMSSFNIAAEDFQEVVDAMAFTAANSNTDIRGLGSAFTFLGATSSSFGLSLNDALGAVAMMGNLGIQAGRAGRNLSSTIGELIEKSDALNLTFLDGNDNIESFAAILQSIQDSGMTTTDIVKNFGQITSRTILALQSAGANMEEVAANARQLGLDVFDAHDRILPMEQVIEAVIEAGLDLTDVMPSAADAVANFVAQTDASGINLEKIAKIAESTQSNVETLTTAVMGSEETFESLGLTSASAVAAILKLQDANIQGAEASNLFNKALTQLSEGADQTDIDIKMVSGGLDELAKVMETLQGEGFDTNKVIEVFGEEAGKLFEVLEKDGVDSLRELTEEMRKTTGAAEGMGARIEDTKADTLTGDVKLLRSAFKGLQTQLTELGAGNLFRKIVQGITTLVKEASRFVTENQGAIKSFFSELGTKIPGIIQSLKSQVGPTLGAIGKAIADGANRIVEFVGKIAQNKDAIASTVKGIGQALGVVRDIVLSVIETFASLPAPIQKFIIAAVGISAVLAPIITLISGFGAGLAALGAMFFTSGAGATGFKAILASLVNPIGLVVAAVVGLAAAFATNFGGIRDKVAETFSKIAEKFTFAEGAFNGFKVVLNALWKSFEQIFELILDAVISTIGIVVNTIANGVKMIGDIFNLLGAIVTGFVTGDWSDALDALKSFASNTFTFVIEIFSGIGQFFVELGGNIVKGFGEGIANAFTGAKQAVEGFANNIIGWFKGVLGIASPSTVFASFGGDVVQGLINGIQGLLQSARNTVTSFANNVSGWFKSVLGIRSPSLEFLKAGESIVEGLIIGVKAKQGEASDAIKELAQKTIAAFDQQVTAIKANLELEIISPQDALTALEQMKVVLLQEVSALKEVGETGGAAFIEIASKINALQSAIDTIQGSLKTLSDQEEQLRKEGGEGREAEFRHRLAMGELGVQAHIGWLNQQIAANRDNIEKRRELELELKDVMAGINQSLAEQLEQQVQSATESAEKQAELRGKFAESMAQRQAKIAEDLHEQGLELNQQGLADYISTLKTREAALIFENKKETEEFALLQEKLTEAEEIFTEQRVSLARSEAKQKLAQSKLSAEGYIKELSRLAKSEEFSVEQRIDLVRELAEFKEDQGKMSLDAEIKLLERLLDTEGLTGEEIKEIYETVADFTVMQFERRTEEAEESTAQQLAYEIELSKEQVELGNRTLEQQLSFLETLLNSTEFTAEQRELIEKALTDTLTELADENRRLWERNTAEIIVGLEKIADSLRDVSPVAASVFDFLAVTAKNVTDRLEELGQKTFTLADAFGAIGAAAQESSNLAIRSLGGLASAIGNFASGNIIGGIVGAVSTGIGLIAGLFGRSSEEAKKHQEELERLRQEAVNWANQLGSGLKSVLKQFDTARFLEGIIGDLPLEKIDDFIKINIEKILDFRERFVNSLEGISAALKRNFFDPLTGEFTDNSKNFLDFYSDFAGKFAGEVQRLQDQLAFAIKSRIAGGSFNISGLEEDLEEALRRLEGWTAEFQRAADFLANSLSSGLSEALTNPNVSIAEAGSKLRDNFQQFVIKTMIDMAVQTALATGVVAAKMADLREKISEAFQTGNWAGVRESVGTIASDLSKMFTDLANNVGGALDDVFGRDLNAQATLDADTIENSTKNITVNLDQQGVETFKTGVEKLEVFNDSFLSSINTLGLKLDNFSLSASSLNAEFAPSISSSNIMFNSSTNKFDHSVNVFQGSVQTFDETTRRDALARENANREQAKLLEEVAGTTSRAAFARFRGRRRSTVQ